MSEIIGPNTYPSQKELHLDTIIIKLSKIKDRENFESRSKVTSLHKRYLHKAFNRFLKILATRRECDIFKVLKIKKLPTKNMLPKKAVLQK